MSAAAYHDDPPRWHGPLVPPRLGPRRPCTYVSGAPRLELAAGLHTEPTIKRAQVAAKAIVKNWRKQFPELVEYCGYFQHPRRRRECRKPGWKREDRLEAIGLVTQYLLARMNVIDWRCGFVKENGRCIGITEAKIVTETGLSPDRVNRALLDLVWAGYIDSAQPIEEYSKGKFAGGPAIRWFLPRFFERLGMLQSVKLAAQAASNKRRDEAHAARKAQGKAPPAPIVRAQVVELVDRAAKEAPAEWPAWPPRPPPE